LICQGTNDGSPGALPSPILRVSALVNFRVHRPSLQDPLTIGTGVATEATGATAETGAAAGETGAAEADAGSAVRPTIARTAASISAREVRSVFWIVFICLS